MRRGVWLAGVTAVVLVAACGLSQHGARKEEPPEFSAERLGDLRDQDSILDTLDPEEREAVQRSGISGPRPAHEDAPPGSEKDEGTLDTAGKMSISFLSVALSVAAVAAPFFLF